MSRILLIQPPIYSEEYAARGSSHTLSLLPPMGLAYIAAYLRAHGHECEIIDGFVSQISLEDIAQRAKKFDVIGITAVSTIALRVNQLIAVLKKEQIKAPIVVGGPHATVLPEVCLENGADFVIMGEGEVPMLELVNALESGKDTSTLKSLAIQRDGKIIRNSRFPLIEDLDMIPMPARDLLPMQLYHNSEARTKKQPSHSLFTSRGCLGTCTFCNKAIFGSKIRYHSVERIVSEFFELRDKYGAEDIGVYDDNFVENHRIVRAVCDELIKRNFNKTWSVEARVDSVDKDLLMHLKRAGCNLIAYGVESGSQKILDRMNKKTTLAQAKKAVRIAKEAGLAIRGYFIMGFPGETKRDMEKTINFALELNVDIASFSLLIPLPGTVEYIRACESGTFRDREYFLHGLSPEFNFPKDPIYVPEGMNSFELLKLHQSAYNRYYFRPGFLLRSIADIRSFDDISRYAKGGLNLLSNAFSKFK